MNKNLEMRNVLILIIITLFIYQAKCDEKTDSLENLLKGNLSYSNEIDKYFELIDYTLEFDVQKALKYINKIEEKVNNKKDYKGKLQVILYKGMAYGILGEFDKSNDLFKKVISQSYKLKTEEFLPRTYLNMGLNYLRVGFLDKAQENIFKAENYAKKFNNKDILASINISKGILFKAKGKTRESIKYFLNAEKYYKSKNDIKNLSTVYINLSNSYIAINQLDEGSFYLKESIKINEKLNNFSSLAISYHNLGALYYEKKDYKESLKWLEKSLQIKLSMNNQIGVATSYMAIGEVYFTLNDYTKSNKYFENALKILEPSQSLTLLMNTYKLMDSLHQKINDYKKAYEYSNKYHRIKDTLNEVEKLKVVDNLKIQNEIAKKDKENSQLKRSYDRQYYLTIILIIVAGFIAILSLLLFIKNRNEKKNYKLLIHNQNIIETKNAELANLNEELSKINEDLKESNIQKDKFFSIVSHDLRSPVSSMYQLLDLLIRDYKNMTEEDKIESLECILDSAKNTFELIQNLLTWSRAQLNRIEFKPQNINAFDMIETTLNLIKPVADAKGISIINKVNTNTELFVDKEMISTVIRNLVSNSIKFTNPGGKIIINLEKSIENENIISIKDTGVGIPDNIAENLFKIGSSQSALGTKNEQGTGLGLLLCKEFIEKHNGKIWFETEIGKGTTFYISLK